MVAYIEIYNKSGNHPKASFSGLAPYGKIRPK